MAVAYAAVSSQLQAYRTNSLLGLTPGQLILKMYDMVLADLAGGDDAHACRVLSELIDCLDFRHPEPAVGLFRLYRFCLEQTKKGEYEVPCRIIKELRDSWARAIARSEHQAS